MAAVDVGAQFIASEMEHRKPLRLPQFDYSTPGAYFVTICVHRKECVFGEVINGEMRMNGVGEAIWNAWNELPTHFPTIETDAFIVMQNHVHGIVLIDDPGGAVTPHPGAETTSIVGAQLIASVRRVGAQFIASVPGTEGVMNHAPTLGDVVRACKAKSTYVIHRSGLPTFRWQRGYYERVIRNERELDAIRSYVVNNPLKWDTDAEHLSS